MTVSYFYFLPQEICKCRSGFRSLFCFQTDKQNIDFMQSDYCDSSDMVKK